MFPNSSLPSMQDNRSLRAYSGPECGLGITLVGPYQAGIRIRHDPGSIQGCPLSALLPTYLWHSTLLLFPTDLRSLMLRNSHMLRSVITLASCFTMGKPHRCWTSSPKYETRLGCCVILGPYFWECPHLGALPYTLP